MKWLIDLLRKKGVLKKFLLDIDSIGIKHHLIHGEKIRTVLNSLESGDCILARAYAEATTTLMGGDYTHTILKTNHSNFLIDATSEGVKRRDILNAFVGVSSICVMRPKLSSVLRQKIADRGEFYATQDIGYDYNFASGNKDMYCSEFYFNCFNDVSPKKLELRERFGCLTITPDDLSKCVRLFERII